MPSWPLATHVAHIGFNDIPSKAIDATKKLILDLISTTIAGAGAPGTAATIDLLKATGGRPQSRIAIYGGALPAHHAVTANIMMCHALELDDLYDPSVVHSSAPAFWSAMAAAESLGGASGRDLLTAMIVASDIMCRLGAAAPRTFSLGHHNALLAGFAAVAAAGHLRKTSANILHNAFGIAFSQAAASVQALPDGSLIKRLQPALNAADGLRSLDFAQNGVTGVINVLEGKFGFCQLFGHAPCDREVLLQDLGSRFLGAESSIKRFPSSRCTHAPIEATLAILKSRKIPIDQIVSIKCMVSQVCADVAGQPFSPTDGSPQVKAQFSIPYTIAATLVNGDFFIPQVNGDICTPRVMDLAQRVEVGFLEEVGDRMTFMPIELAIKMKSGETIFHRLETLKGTPQNPMSWEEVIDERLTRCLDHSVREFSGIDVSRLIELVQNLEHVPDVRAILDILT